MIIILKNNKIEIIPETNNDKIESVSDIQIHAEEPPRPVTVKIKADDIVFRDEREE